MGNALLSAVKARLPTLPRGRVDGAILPASRAALTWLADAAPDATGLTWLGQPSLAKLIGCAGTYVGTALKQLEAAGLISIWDRTGRPPLYLVHPNGIAAAGPLRRKAVQEHLSEWRKVTPGERAGALEWLASIGALDPTSAAGPNVLHLSTQSKGSVTSARPFDAVEGDPSTQLKATLQRSRTEPKGNPKGTLSAGPRPAEVGGLAGATADDVPAGTSRTDALDLANKARMIGDLASERKWNEIAAQLRAKQMAAAAAPSHAAGVAA